MKRFIIILAFFTFFLNVNSVSAENFVTKDYKVLTKDNFTIVATLQYPKIKQKKEFSTVVLLHSVGYNSEWWADLPKDLLDKGYAVLKIDLRGHGKSVYNSKLVRTSWTGLKNKAFAKYPDDVVTTINYISKENKRVFFKDWAFVGADIGASTAIISANRFENKPKTIVILSPVVNARGLYVPVKLAELNNIDILSITGKDDLQSQKANAYLSKFAQSTYTEYSSGSTTTGMMLLNRDEMLSPFICSWIDIYLKN